MATTLIVEWTRSSVRAALVVGSGPGTRIRALHSQPAGGPGEDVSAPLRAFLASAKPAAMEVIAIVSREQVITRVVEFPAIERAELNQMVDLYAKAQLPYPREQAVMDFSVLRRQGGMSTVAIVACQREVIDRQLAFLREADLTPSLVTVSAWGVLGWYRRTLRQAGGKMGKRSAPAEEPRLVVNVDDTRTDLVLIADGRILSSRSVGQGAQDWESVGQVSELLVMEVERSRAAIRKELPGAEVHSLLLTGLGPLLQWKDELAQRLSLAVTVIDAARPLRFAKPGMSAGLPYSPVVIGGLAHSAQGDLLDLSPPEVRGQVRHRKEVSQFAWMTGLLILVLMLGSLLLYVRVFREQQAANALDQEIRRLEPTAKQVQDKGRVAQVVSVVLQDRHQLALILAGVLGQTPSTITLEGVACERRAHELALKGHATSRRGVLDYMKVLERLEGVGRVDLKYSTQRSLASGERTDFELVLRLGRDANASTAVLPMRSSQRAARASGVESTEDASVD